MCVCVCVVVVVVKELPGIMAGILFIMLSFLLLLLLLNTLCYAKRKGIDVCLIFVDNDEFQNLSLDLEALY